MIQHKQPQQAVYNLLTVNAKNTQIIIKTNEIQEETDIIIEIHAVEAITVAAEVIPGIKAGVNPDIVIQVEETNIDAIVDIETMIDTEVTADIEVEPEAGQVDQRIPEDPNRVIKRNTEIGKSMAKIDIKNHDIEITVEITTIKKKSIIRVKIIITDGNAENVEIDIQKVPHALPPKEQKINTLNEDQKEISM